MTFRESDTDIGAFLISINLGQYRANFKDFGYHTVQECLGINDRVLQNVGISPTGHRRRILKQLEAVLTRMPETATSDQSGSPRHLLHPKQVNEAGGGPSDGHSNTACGSNCERNPHYTSHVLLGNRDSSPVLDLDSSDTFGPNLLADPTTVPRSSLKNVTSEKKPCMEDHPKTGEPETSAFQVNAAPEDGSLSSAFSPAEEKSSQVELLSGFRSLLQETPFFEFKGELAEEKPPPISPYGETFLMNSHEEMEIYNTESSEVSEEKKEKKRTTSKTGLATSNQNPETAENEKDPELASQGDQSPFPKRFVGEAESALLKECSRYAWRGKYKPAKGLGEFKSGSLDLDAKDQMFSSPADCGDELVPGSNDTITPYACYYAPAAKKVKEGWLDKLSPQGKHVFQKRWVKFDGESMAYYNNDKDIYSKGIILLSAIATVRMHGDNKFEVVTAHRIFVFRAEKEEERNNWVTAIFTALRALPAISRARTAVPPEKSGYLELKGYKAKIFTLLQGNSVWICKNNQDFKSGYGITVIPMNVANVRQIDRAAKQSFEIITPYRSFRAMFTFEICLLSERAFLFGAETAHSQRKWTQAIAKHFVPELAQGLQERETDVIGQLFYKDCQDLDNWKKGWFALEKTSLYFYLELENSQENSMHLRRLQELTISSCVQNGEKTDVLLLVEKGRTLYIRGHTKLDFTVWRSAIEKAAGTDGNMLEDQQLSKNDVPIIVTSCIAFVTQYGLGSKHIYLKNGDPLCVRELLEGFKKDARSVKLRTGKNRLEDVTDTLKCFLSEIDDALLTKELYPFWISALDTLDDKERVRKYSSFIRTLPPINKATLAALMEHLYRVQKCSEINLMDPHHLAMALSSCLFQTKGQTSEEVDVVEDLIINYVQLFDIQQDQVKQMDIENSFITKWKDTQISPTMEAEELTNDVLGIKNITPHKDDTWATFEVIENGELERPLHCTENILEQILHWSSLASPSNASLIIKKFPTVGLMDHCSDETSKGPVKAGYLKYKEEPSKLLSANKFQDRYFVLREAKLWLYKDMKSSKAEKAFPVNSLKLYLGVKKKLKPPT
ncbi:arf-GAP with Rho-GAP domain, ANK repeat and PH domain-containing protein 2-like, partial [Protobothrops mucrosquamatus]|uniref:arf-GAP with Rho-GAP domain, ANK repeat and PH domain-containing protein 2-like n=1 Tax=Protobothrops mucrosquamatus TaxID=103944 RepID=UPI0010FAF4EC